MNAPHDAPHPAETSQPVMQRSSDQAGNLPAPVDLADLLSNPRPELAFIIEPLIVAGKEVGIVGRRGEGKSLLALDMAAAAASGTQCLDQPEGDPVHVIYIDMEMGPDDLYDRLVDLGYGPDHPRFDLLVEHLHYYQLPALPPLDTEAGGETLEQLVDRDRAAVVIIDTVSRVISGSENDAEPFLSMFRHTETRLKRRGVAVCRLDHFGKDTSRGSRGHSAKEDPLDIVWELTVDRDQLTLKRTKGRQPGIPERITVVRNDDNGTLQHTIPAGEPLTDKAVKVVRDLDRLKVPNVCTVNEAQHALRDAEAGAGRTAISQAVRYRKKRVGNGSEPLSGTETGNRFGTAPEPPGTAAGSHREPRVPSKEGTAVPGRLIGCDVCGRPQHAQTCRDCKQAGAA